MGNYVFIKDYKETRIDKSACAVGPYRGALYYTRKPLDPHKLPNGVQTKNIAVIPKDYISWLEHS